MRAARAALALTYRRQGRWAAAADAYADALRLAPDDVDLLAGHG
jgi:cytochrome c-type biogenesis protein CcmH/NrfG